MSIKAISTVSRLSKYIGLSTDTKPTIASHDDLPIPCAGSTFFEYDSKRMFITYDGTNWVNKEGASDISVFGKPALVAGGHGRIYWDKEGASRAITGFSIEMIPGVQTSWDDYCKVAVPVNNMPLTDLSDAKWQYYMSATEAMGFQLIVHVHNPTDLDQEAEISQQADHSSIDKASGYNSHELNTSTDYFYYYGYSSDSDLTEGAPNYYGLDDFQADAQFSTWVVDGIGIAYGYHTGGGTFDSANLYNFEVNGVNIPLKPVGDTFKKTVIATKTLVGGANSAGDVLSESAGSGTDYDFDFGGIGKITKATLDIATASLTAETELLLFGVAVTANLNDNVANTAPATADVPYFQGSVAFPALKSFGTGHSYSVATPSTKGNVGLGFDYPVLYGVHVSVDAMTPGNVLCTIMLEAEMKVD